MSAPEVIRAWHDLVVGKGKFMAFTLTATQGGPPAGGRPVVQYASGFMVRGDHPGEVKTSVCDVLFSDRLESGRQPFNVGAHDRNEYTFLPSGTLREHSETWDFVQDIVLTDAGSGTLTGWGGSIGGTGQNGFWVIVASNIVQTMTDIGDVVR